MSNFLAVLARNTNSQNFTNRRVMSWTCGPKSKFHAHPVLSLLISKEPTLQSVQIPRCQLTHKKLFEMHARWDQGIGRNYSNLLDYEILIFMPFSQFFLLSRHPTEYALENQELGPICSVILQSPSHLPPWHFLALSLDLPSGLYKITQ